MNPTMPMSQAEMHERNLFKELNQKWEQEMIIAEARCESLRRRLDEIESKIKTSEMTFNGQHRMLKQTLQEAYEARENLKEAASHGDKETLDKIFELASLINKWSGNDY